VIHLRYNMILAASVAFLLAAQTDTITTKGVEQIQYKWYLTLKVRCNKHTQKTWPHQCDLKRLPYADHVFAAAFVSDHWPLFQLPSLPCHIPSSNLGASGTGGASATGAPGIAASSGFEAAVPSTCAIGDHPVSPSRGQLWFAFTQPISRLAISDA
jgi:hypothetical protein